jgi:hypothetical protein
MRHRDVIDLPRRQTPFRRSRHPYERGGPSRMPRSVLQHLLKASTWRAHPEPFAKTKRGGQRRDERRFIARRKCGFCCGRCS